MNCGFCAFGEKWGLIAESHEWSDEAIIKAARAFVDEGASWVTLRTTEFTGLTACARWRKRMREAVPGNYGLVVNTGEFGPLEARAMIASGHRCRVSLPAAWGRADDMLPARGAQGHAVGGAGFGSQAGASGGASGA